MPEPAADTPDRAEEGSNQPAVPGTAAGRRLAVFVVAGVLTVMDLTVKSWAQRRLAGGRTVELGVVDLQLAFNPGVAFSLGSTLPAGVVLAVTGTVTAGVAVLLWRAARDRPLALQMPLTMVLAGAASNLADRAADGLVTDYLHTGWFPTFNGADVLITSGAAALFLTSLRTGHTTRPAGGHPGR